MICLDFSSLLNLDPSALADQDADDNDDAEDSYEDIRHDEAVKYIRSQGISAPFGTELAKSQWLQAKAKAIAEGMYAGKSLALGGGGKTQMLIHQLIINHDMSWESANNVVAKIRVQKYGPDYPWRKVG